MDPDPDPGGPKTCGYGGSGSGFASVSATLVCRWGGGLTLKVGDRMYIENKEYDVFAKLVLILL